MLSSSARWPAERLITRDNFSEKFRSPTYESHRRVCVCVSQCQRLDIESDALLYFYIFLSLAQRHRSRLAVYHHIMHSRWIRTWPSYVRQRRLRGGDQVYFLRARGLQSSDLSSEYKKKIRKNSERVAA
jgi:hypothetical protein